MTGSPAITGIPKLSAATREERPAFYVDEPDIPDGMTCDDWRRRRRPLAAPGLVARFRWWQRRHRLREPLS